MTAEVDEVRRLVRGWAAGFASNCRKNPSPGEKRRRDLERKETLTEGKGGLQPDECRAFLRSYGAGLVRVDPDGCFSMPEERTHKHTLHLVGRDGDHLRLHTEYLTQIGAYGELVLDHGWSRHALAFEMGEFDILGFAATPDLHERAALLVEAKARISGGDSLFSLREAFIAKSADPAFLMSAHNHRRKWDELEAKTQGGLSFLWLVASGARWSFLARRVGSRMLIDSVETLPDHETIKAITSSR